MEDLVDWKDWAGRADPTPWRWTSRKRWLHFILGIMVVWCFGVVVVRDKIEVQEEPFGIVNRKSGTTRSLADHSGSWQIVENLGSRCTLSRHCGPVLFLLSSPLLKEVRSRLSQDDHVWMSAQQIRCRLVKESMGDR
jgi:hypothetical protein